MKELLKEYLKLIIEDSVSLGQSSLTASKIVGYAAEWATWEACGGGNGFEEASKRDKRIKDIYAKSNNDLKNQFESTYRLMVKAAKEKIAQIKKTNKKLSFSGPVRPDAGTGTDKVDVVTSDVDIHVKFNDPTRLAGFQREKPGVESSKTAKVYDHVMKTFGSSLDIPFIDKNGFLRRPGGVKGMSKMDVSGKAAALKLKNKFQKARDEYNTAFTKSENNELTPGYREEFIEALDKAGIRQAILKDIKNQLLGDSGRATIYFKYFSKGSGDVRLDTHQYSIDDMIVVPIEPTGDGSNKGESTKFYRVTNKDKSKIYFEIEFRLDGGGHPPQLKVGKDLDTH